MCISGKKECTVKKSYEIKKNADRQTGFQQIQDRFSTSYPQIVENICSMCGNTMHMPVSGRRDCPFI